jgi:drug/metabolite transporter (DMT)-like permease
MASSGKVSGADFISNIFVILLRPWILAGLGAYVVSVLVWMWVLAKSDVGFAYPFVSIGYIFAMVAAVFIFNEQFFWQRMVGVLVIFVGVLLITWTPSLTSN